MKDFLLVFRADWDDLRTGSPEEIQARTKRWMDWIGNIAAQNKLVNAGHRLHSHGKVVRDKDVITDGPYAEIKETIGGYSMVKASSYDEAVALVKGCPVLVSGGAVEVREINPL